MTRTSQAPIAEYKGNMYLMVPSTLTIKQVIAELRAIVKGHLHAGLKQSTYSQVLARIEAGTAKPCTIKALFNRFGYEGEFNEWRKGAVQ